VSKEVSIRERRRKTTKKEENAPRLPQLNGFDFDPHHSDCQQNEARDARVRCSAQLRYEGLNGAREISMIERRAKEGRTSGRKTPSTSTVCAPSSRSTNSVRAAPQTAAKGRRRRRSGGESVLPAGMGRMKGASPVLGSRHRENFSMLS
jgi:hypothetical protein